MRRTLIGVAAAGAFALVAVPSALAASTGSASAASIAVSENWSGYVVSGSSDFSSVSGSWVQPSASSDSANSYAAFWVGLGGASGQSDALEQVGTQAEITASGQTEYYAWYELVPSAAVKLDVAIHAGDRVSARMTVSGTSVTMWLADDTTGRSVTKTLQMSDPDTSTAEWIAEAPSASDGYGQYEVLPLADFGTMTFADATATANGHTGSISDSHWSSEEVELSSSGAVSGPGFVSESSSADAQPSSLASDGSSFSVKWESASLTSTGASTTSTSTGAGAGPGGYPSGPSSYGYGSGSGPSVGP